MKLDLPILENNLVKLISLKKTDFNLLFKAAADQYK